MDWFEEDCLDISNSEVDPEVLTRNFDEEINFEHEFDIDKCFEIAFNKSDSNNLFEMVDKADQAMDLEKALRNNEEINVESLVESDGETKLQHGLEIGSENKKNDFDFMATQSQSQTFKNKVDKPRDETTIFTNLDLEDLPISQIRKPHRRIRKDNFQAEFKAEMKKRLESSESCLKWKSNNPPLLHYKSSTIMDNEKPQSKTGKSQRSKRSDESSTKNEEIKIDFDDKKDQKAMKTSNFNLTSPFKKQKKDSKKMKKNGSGSVQVEFVGETIENSAMDLNKAIETALAHKSQAKKISKAEGNDKLPPIKSMENEGLKKSGFATEIKRGLEALKCMDSNSVAPLKVVDEAIQNSATDSKIQDENVSADQGKGEFKCIICGKKFADVHELGLHGFTHFQ